MSRPTEIFLSHATADRAFALRIADLLTRHNLPFWYSDRDIVGAQQWHDEIGAALQRCDWFLVVLSPASAASRWVKRELLFALDQDAYENHIVVIDHQDTDYRKLSWTLRSFQWVGFQSEFEASCRELLRVWSIGFRPPS